jgi:UDP-glucose:(heptosyl)LPS alpha-1,3-glucosyltransferase
MKLNPYHLYTLASERRLFASPRLRAVICNSRMVAGEIARRFGVPEAKLHVIHNGVDLEHFHPRCKDEHRGALRASLGIPERDTVFLFVGGGFERKGLPRLLEACARLANTNTNTNANANARLVIVGADRRANAMRARAAALGIAARTVWAGAQDEVLPWYGAADCLVLPTLYDPFPNVALEAMACGLPLITSTSCGAAELIEEGRQGFVCDALDVEALAARLQRMTPDACAEMGRQARVRSLDFSLADMAQRLTALYRSLL